WAAPSPASTASAPSNSTGWPARSARPRCASTPPSSTPSTRWASSTPARSSSPPDPLCRLGHPAPVRAPRRRERTRSVTADRRNVHFRSSDHGAHLQPGHHLATTVQAPYIGVEVDDDRQDATDRDAGRPGQGGPDRQSSCRDAPAPLGIRALGRGPRSRPRARRGRHDADAGRAVRHADELAGGAGRGPPAAGGRKPAPPVLPSMTDFRSEGLGESHRIEDFGRGKEPLDSWLREQSRRAQSAGIARPYVWTRPGSPEVLAYYAIAPTQVARADLPRVALAGGYSAVPGYLL